MYKAVFLLNPIGEFLTFKDAFKALYDVICEGIVKQILTWQTLETTTWIEPKEESPISFYAARDIMCEMGYLVDGKWVDNV